MKKNKDEFQIEIKWIHELRTREKIIYLNKKQKVYQGLVCKNCGWLNTDEDEKCFRCDNKLNKDKKVGHGISIELPEPLFSDNFEDISLRKLSNIDYKELKAFHKLKKYDLESGIENLISLNKIDIIHYDYQINTVLKIMNNFGGRALLCDEVGLGKTIEALLFLKEYHERGLIKSALILVPSTLIYQWYEELKYKFGMNFHVGHFSYDKWVEKDFILVSLDTAKKERFSEHILKRQFDIIIVDEAHRLRNSNALANKFVRKLKKRFIIFLSATPIQNNLSELYNLISVIKPGLLGTSKRMFNKNYVDKEDKRKAKNETVLRQKINEVMIRNRRDNTGVFLPKRYTAIAYLNQSEAENLFYDKVTDFCKNIYEKLYEKGGNIFPVLTVQRELGSSKESVLKTLIRISEKYNLTHEEFEQVLELKQISEKIDISSKTQAIMHIIKQHNLENEKIIIYTCFYQTLYALKHFFESQNMKVNIFHGGLNSMARKNEIETFKASGQILISTDAGSEGLNLQFVSNLINYDLPWNPMKIEQRIGRIHRLGQEKEVFVWNLAFKNTIEHRILSLLVDKIKLFENVIGNIELILGDNIITFEKRIYDIVKHELEGKDTSGEFEKLSNELEFLYKKFEKNVKNLKNLDHIIESE